MFPEYILVNKSVHVCVCDQLKILRFDLGNKMMFFEENLVLCLSIVLSALTLSKRKKVKKNPRTGIVLQ